MLKKLLVSVLLGGVSRSDALEFDLKDLTGAVRTGALAALCVAGIAFFQDVEAQTVGGLEPLVDGLCVAAVDFLRRTLKSYRPSAN